jgi:hypothetical protein
MLFGRSFRLRTATLGIAVEDGKRTFVTVHPGSILKVLSDCQDLPNALVNVLIDGSVVEMFAVDIRSRGEELRETKSPS